MSQYFDNDVNLKSERIDIIYKYKDSTLNFISDLGIFSKNKIDYGSKLLVESYLESGSEFKKVLDVGCGYGFIGIVISKFKNCHVDMIDINKRAVHLSNINIKNNHADVKSFVSDIYNSVNDLYDVIITNPPIRAGKSVYLNIINNSFNYLKSDGELWFVMNKTHGAKTVIDNLSKVYNVNILKKDKGFFIIRCLKS